ncbi:hypothetical protein ACFOLK_16080 [Marinococcus halophilus]|uniref:hypothetical protein n=1 Tax=Marinococcus halophilus TaxID=1371 RepID=UPI00362380FA
MKSDTEAFEKAVEEATAYSEEHEDTLVVVASDTTRVEAPAKPPKKIILPS